MNHPHHPDPAQRRELDVHPVVMDYLARVGEALMDPSTPGGERRPKAKYADRTEPRRIRADRRRGWRALIQRDVAAARQTQRTRAVEGRP
jgi:hypothetical protein